MKIPYIYLKQEVLLCEDHKILNLGNGDKQTEGRPDHPGSHPENHMSRFVIQLYVHIYVMICNTPVHICIHVMLCNTRIYVNIYE